MEAAEPTKHRANGYYCHWRGVLLVQWVYTYKLDALLIFITDFAKGFALAG